MASINRCLLVSRLKLCLKISSMRKLINVSRNASTLRSSQIIYDSFGDPKIVLKAQEVDISLKHIGQNDVLIKMLMAPINPSDINMIEGTYFIRPPLPAIVGNEGVGEIIQTGNSVTKLRVGDWVIPGDSGWGTWRQFAIAPESSVFQIDNNIPTVSAATILVNPTTAYRMLKDYTNLKPGDTIIQNGANSAVGQSVIQLARHWNIRTINIVRDRPDIDSLKQYLTTLGADTVITEEYCRTPDMKMFMKSLPSPPKLGLNCVGGKSASEIIRNLGQGGTMVTYGGMSRKPIIVPTGALLFKEIKLQGYWNTEWNKRNKDSQVRVDMYKDLCQLIRSEDFKTPSYELYSIDQFKDAVSSSMEEFAGTKKILVFDKDVK